MENTLPRQTRVINFEQQGETNVNNKQKRDENLEREIQQKNPTKNERGDRRIKNI